MLTLNIMLMLGSSLNLLLGLVNRGLGMGYPQGCPLSMTFLVVLFLPWCKYLAAQEGVEPQSYADNLKSVSRDPSVPLRAARFTTGYVLVSASKVVRRDMRDWTLTDEGDRWTDVGTLMDTWIPLFVVVLPPWLLGSGWLFDVWSLSSFFR